MVTWIVIATVIAVLIMQSIYEEVGTTAKKKKKRKKPDPRIKHYRELLDDHYKCREPYTIEVCNCKPKHYMGLYFPGDAIIRIYAGWQKYYSLDEIALHEYAHHIQHTEYPETLDPDNIHNQTFTDILNSLRQKTL